jgi:hypothetical protein
MTDEAMTYTEHAVRVADFVQKRLFEKCTCKTDGNKKKQSGNKL